MDTPVDTALRDRVVDTICAVVPRLTRQQLPTVGEGTRLMEDLNLSSSSTLELMLEIEESLEIQINVEDIDRDDFRTVGTLADFVAGNLLDE
ncbi:MAG TPA: phosphopantetheine-binding protein [Rugosimonospora sp.]|nr:phosphopantetheine-binding protein [Rugosimonospora sp.]